MDFRLFVHLNVVSQSVAMLEREHSMMAIGVRHALAPGSFHQLVTFALCRHKRGNGRLNMFKVQHSKHMTLDQHFSRHFLKFNVNKYFNQ